MLGYTLKSILELVPEALPLVKQASIEQDWPLGNKDSCIASALALGYHSQISGKVVDYEVIEKVASAVTAYGVQDDVDTLVKKLGLRAHDRLEKSASAPSEAKFLEKQATWIGGLSGVKKLEELVKQAQELYEYATSLGVTPNDDVCKYSGHALLSKEAAINSLQARYAAKPDEVLLKIASAISQEGGISEFISNVNTVKSLCRTITGWDKSAGLLEKGFDFYRETLFTKQAATQTTTVTLAGKSYPLQMVQRIPKEHLEHYLGKDFSEEISSDPVTAKAVIDTLPLDLQQILSTLLKSC